MKIILIGFMGSGKTTVASILAKKLNLEVIEMDDLIIKKSGKSINQIFNQDGEERFREMEIEVSKSLMSKDECIISSGGGIVMNKINIDFLRKNGKIVFLKKSFSEIIEHTKLTMQEQMIKERAKSMVAGQMIDQLNQEIPETLQTEENLEQTEASSTPAIIEKNAP